jgi:CubicO group peptidase (beta-lactamase class C family)
MGRSTGTSIHQGLDDALDDWVEEHGLPGLAVQVSDGDAVAYQYLHGWRSPGERNDADTLFGVASITKSLTAVAVLLLEQQGRLGIDHPIGAWLPALRLPGRAEERVLVRHLLSHTGGLPGLSVVHGARTRSILADPDHTRLRALPPISPEYEHVRTVDDVVQALSAAQPALLGEPGEVFNYSNEGFALLQGVIEAASGQDFRSLVEAQVLRPLGIERSAFTSGELARCDNVCALYAPFRDSAEAYSPSPAWWDVADIHTNGSWKTSSSGLSAFTRMLTHAAAGRPTAVLSPESAARMTSVAARLPDGSAYGLGAETGRLGEQSWFGHGGSIKGVASHYRCFPDAGLTITVLINASDADSTGPTDLVSRHLLDLPADRPTPTPACAAAAGSVSVSERPDSYAGEYASLEKHTLRVIAASAGLEIIGDSSPTPRPIHRSRAQTFTDSRGRTYTFLRNQQHEIDAVFTGKRVLPRSSYPPSHRPPASQGPE